jgi:lysophospholipase L1-like esterase
MHPNSQPAVNELDHNGATVAGAPEPRPSSGNARDRGSAPPSLSLRKKIAFALFTVFVVPLLLVAIGEIGGRIYLHFRYGVPGKSYGIYMADDELGATHRPNSYNTNSVINNYGFRNNEDISETKSPGALRIYCSGGSTTYCYNLDTEAAWPSLLQEKLRQAKGHKRDEVLNAGQITYGLAQEYILAKRFIPQLKPDIALIFTGVNEVTVAKFMVDQEGQDLDQLLTEERWGVIPKAPDQARFLKRNSVIVRLLDYPVKTLLHRWADREIELPAEPIHPWVRANYEHTLREYLAFLQANGCKPGIIRFGDNGKDEWHLRKCIRVLRDRAVEIGKEEGALIFDLVPVAENHPHRRNLYLPTGIHVTREGAEVYSDFLLEKLLALDVKTATR